MRDELLYYYERELSFLRRMGAEFAQKYPKVASRLMLEPAKCEDPHVERLLEGFAFLAARVHLKLDDDLSEISEALLQVVHPHHVRPVPSMSIVTFEMDPEQGKLTTGFPIPRESPLYSKPVGGTPCRFRTCYETTLWPLSVVEAQWVSPDRLRPAIKASDAVAALRLVLRCFPDVTFGKLQLETLRLYLNGESALVSTLYELLCSNCVQVIIRDPAPNGKRSPITLPPSVVRPVGFAKDEGMLPYPRQSLLAHRLLQEYFTFPEKFSFIDLAGFDQVRAAGFGTEAEVVLLISPFERPERRQALESGVTPEVLKLGCTPVVNLFPQTSEPVPLTETRYEHVIVPDARRRATTEIYSVDEVSAAAPGGGEPRRFEPFYSYRHARDGGGARVFWHISRRPAGWRTDLGTDVYLAFADASGGRANPEAEVVTARLTCFNSDLPSRLPFGVPEGDFEMPGGGPIRRIATLVKPTPAIRPPLGKPQLWRLISQLSLNSASLVEEGAEGLQELLRLHNAGESAVGENHVQGIKGLTAASCYARLDSSHGITFARGHRVEIEFDEEHFTGGGVYLLASVLEHFLALYCSMNSFSVLAARTRQRKQLLREWPPRAGWKPLL
jgi:type VI secretion system protein ImpG